MTRTKQLCRNIEGEMPELSIFNNKEINLEELNFLIKRLESFSQNELRQWKAAVYIKKTDNLKDMINLTFNLHNFTLITDVSNPSAVGKVHRLNTEGAILLNETYDYAVFGTELINSGKGKLTPYGLLFENNLFTEDVYDGQVFPQFFYEECVTYAMIEYNGKQETLYMPCEDSAILRMLSRLGAESIDDCSQVLIDFCKMQTDWLTATHDGYNCSQLFGLNALSKAVEYFDDEELYKLVAICNFTHTDDFEKATHIAEHLECFEFVPEVSNVEELGRYLIKSSGKYEYDENLSEYYDYNAFGLKTKREQEGEFIRKGYIGFKSKLWLEDIFHEENENAMGGLQL